MLSKGARGVRLNPQHDQKARAKIATSQIVNRLSSFVLEEKDPQTGKPVQMTKTQVAAALGLLRKTLPDLTTTTINDERRDVEEMSTHELVEYLRDYREGRRGTVEAQDGEGQPDPVH